MLLLIDNYDSFTWNLAQYFGELGANVKGFVEGELVAIPPLIPCRKCDQCLTTNYSRCKDYSYIGSRRDGAYAEYVNVPVGNLLKAPQTLDPRAVAMTDPARELLRSKSRLLTRRVSRSPRISVSASPDDIDQPAKARR